MSLHDLRYLKACQNCGYFVQVYLARPPDCGLVPGQPGGDVGLVALHSSTTCPSRIRVAEQPLFYITASRAAALLEYG